MLERSAPSAGVPGLSQTPAVLLLLSRRFSPAVFQAREALSALVVSGLTDVGCLHPAGHRLGPNREARLRAGLQPSLPGRPPLLLPDGEQVRRFSALSLR